MALAAPAVAAKPAPPPTPAPLAEPLAVDTRLIENIFMCLSPGLPQDWKKTWIVVTANGGKHASKFYFATDLGDDVGEELKPCDAQEVTRRIAGLNDKLPPDRRGWSRAVLLIDNEGDFEISYDYPK